MNKNLESFANSFFEEFYKKLPVLATSIGIHDYDNTLSSLSKENIEEMKKKLDEALLKINELKKEELTNSDKIDLKTFENIVKTQKIELELLKSHERDPSTYVFYPLYGLFLLVIRDFASAEERFENLLSRFKEVKKFINDGKENLKNPPEIFSEIALEYLKGAEMFYKSLPMLITFSKGGFSFSASKFLKGLLSSKSNYFKELKRAQKETLETLENFKQEIKNQKFGASKDFKATEEVFTTLLKETNLLPYNLKEVKEIGLEYFNKTKNSLEELAKKIDSTTSWSDTINALKKSHSKSNKLLDYYKKEMVRIKEFVISKEIITFPEVETIEVIKTPQFERHIIPYAAYMSPAPFEKKQKGFFYVTPINTRKSKDEQERQLMEHSYYSVPITILHESYPGHHLQLTIANKNSSFIRKHSMSSLFAEGWALYCEELMGELGFYDDKMKMFQLKDMLWRSARIIIDTSLHSGEMSFDEAVNFLVNEVFIEKNSAIAEVKRYTTTPVQPSTYLLGKIEILKLKERASKKSLSLKEFHDKLLSFGSLPFSIFESEF